MSKEPRLIIVGGPSGSGKTSTAAFIAEKYPLIVHYRQQLTTRQPRENEYNHRPYIYLANGELEEMRKRGEIVVITDFAGNFYAYDNRFVQSVKAHFGQGKSIVVDSIHSIHDWLRFSQETGIKLLTIFLYSNDINLLRERVKSRQQIDEATLEERMEHAKNCLQEKEFFDYSLDTTNFDDSFFEKLETIIWSNL